MATFLYNGNIVEIADKKQFEIEDFSEFDNENSQTIDLTNIINDLKLQEKNGDK